MLEKDRSKSASAPQGVSGRRLAQAGASRRAPRQPSRQPSIKDIARLARVSHPTVSRALQNSPLVNPATAAKIRKIAEAAGYRPSAVARGLVTRRTRTVGLVVTTVADPFASGVACGIEQAANDHGYAVFLANSNANAERERKVVQALAERRVDGIIVTSSRVGSDYLPMLAQLNVPMVLVNDQYPGEFVHSVMIANEDGSRAATEHLIELGHRRIAYVGDRSGYQTETERLEGYKQALAGAGIAFDAEHAVHGDGWPGGAAAAMEALLKTAEPPTAVCCYNDMTAMGVMRAIRARGLRVPEDVSVTGFDDLFFAEFLEPPLTTVRQPMRRMGEMAMENLLKLMAGEDSVAQVKVEAELIVRGSTGRVHAHPSDQTQEFKKQVLRLPSPSSARADSGSDRSGGGTHRSGAGRRNG
ncbi:MAG TPA: LacI family DNA-binding transcriptional regulator [Terracidiphilus sp.]|jgi:DNA-binding LacI/PurR family transcriptional regulator